MDFGFAVSASAPPSASSILDGWPILILAAGVWLLEANRRNEGAPQVGLCMPKCSHLIPQFAPEATALLFCAVLTALLLQRGDSPTPTDAAEDQINMQIRNDWPLLMTADSLLAIQAMLRLLLLASTALRQGITRGVDAAPLLGAPATLMLCASIARVVLLAFCPDLSLDGPLGGLVNTVFEVAALPLLVILSRGTARGVKCIMTISVLAAGWIAATNRFAIADDSWFNALFSSVYVLESAASIAFLLRTVATCGACKSPTLNLLHLWLPVQQALSFYYFLVAFEEWPGLIGAGQPFHLMKACGVVQISAYIAAAALQFAMEHDEVIV